MYSNLELKRKTHLAYIERNKERIKLQKKKRYEENKEQIKASGREYGKVYRQKNKDLIRQKQKQYHQRHPFKYISKVSNRNVKKIYSIEEKIHYIDLYRLAKIQKCKCALTGEVLTRQNISIDHIIPLSKGGLHHKSNIQLVCYDVNISKNSMSDEEFLNMCKKVVSYSSQNTVGNT